MPTNNQITRNIGGQTNSGPGTVLENLKHNNPAFYHQLFDDCDKFTAADWVVTATGAATETIRANIDGGILRMQNTGALNDLVSIQYAGGTGAVNQTFQFDPTSPKDVLFACSIATDSALNANILVGLAIADTTPIASLPATGMFIFKPAASLFPQGYMQNASVGTLTAQAQTPMADNTFIDLAIFYSAYDGNCIMYMGTPGVTGGNTPASQVVASQFRLPAPLTLPVASLAPTISLSNGTAAARLLDVDWWYAAKARRSG